MSKQKKVLPKALKKNHNVQIPVELLGHPDLDIYCVSVFAYMKLRFQYFNNYLKTTYHESNTTIAAATGISRRKVIDCISMLEKAGFVTKTVRNKAGVDKAEQTNIYVVRDCLSGSKIEKVANEFQWDLENDPF